MVNHKIIRVQFDKLQRTFLQKDCSNVFVLFHLEFLVTDRSDSEGLFHVESSLTLVKPHRLYSTACRIGSTSWTIVERRVLGVFFTTRRRRNKHNFHNRSQEKSARSSRREDFYFVEGSAPCFFSRFKRCRLLFPSINPCAFSQFSSVISREKSHHPSIEISKIHDRIVLHRLFEFRPNYDFLYQVSRLSLVSFTFPLRFCSLVKNEMT